MTSRVIVITGASGGIGAAIARQCAGRGDKVVLAARRLVELKQVAAECGNDALAVVTDVTRRADVEHLRDEALRVFSHVDVWINNAGIYPRQPADEMTEADWRRHGWHSESGAYHAELWLEIYARHAHDHAGQIRRLRETLGGPR